MFGGVKGRHGGTIMKVKAAQVRVGWAEGVVNGYNNH